MKALKLLVANTKTTIFLVRANKNHWNQFGPLKPTIKCNSGANPCGRNPLWLLVTCCSCESYLTTQFGGLVVFSDVLGLWWSKILTLKFSHDRHYTASGARVGRKSTLKRLYPWPYASFSRWIRLLRSIFWSSRATLVWQGCSKNFRTFKRISIDRLCQIFSRPNQSYSKTKLFADQSGSSSLSCFDTGNFRDTFFGRKSQFSYVWCWWTEGRETKMDSMFQWCHGNYFWYDSSVTTLNIIHHFSGGIKLL